MLPARRFVATVNKLDQSVRERGFPLKDSNTLWRSPSHAHALANIIKDVQPQTVCGVGFESGFGPSFFLTMLPPSATVRYFGPITASNRTHAYFNAVEALFGDRLIAYDIPWTSIQASTIRDELPPPLATCDLSYIDILPSAAVTTGALEAMAALSGPGAVITARSNDGGTEAWRSFSSRLGVSWEYTVTDASGDLYVAHT